MTITFNASTRAWLSAKMPNIRVAIPALRCGGTASRAITPPNATRKELEKQFREDFEHLSQAKTQAKITPNLNRLPTFSARNITSAIRRAA